MTKWYTSKYEIPQGFMIHYKWLIFNDLSEDTVTVTSLDLIYHGEDTNYLYVLNWIIYLLAKIYYSKNVIAQNGEIGDGIFLCQP